MDRSDEEYPRPSLTADVVLVALGEGRALRVLFIRRAHDPFAGAWALPGGFVEPNETAAEGAARELAEETGVRGVELEELGCFSRPGRDPRGWVVSIAHLAPVPASRTGEAKAGDDAAETAWLDVTLDARGAIARVERAGQPAGALAFDHAEILAAAAKRLRARADELAFRLLPPSFTLADARRALEAIAGAELDPAEVRERLLGGGIVVHDEGGLFMFAGAQARWPIARDRGA